MYRVNLEEFEGPLDLLLYFIRRDELDIFDIPIARIADEYLSYVRVLHEVDLDSVGDFLYMAALLISIKARMLLPAPSAGEDGEEPVDPRRELVERLLEYVRFKEAAERLSVLHEERLDRFTRRADDAREAHGETEVRVEASLFDLVSALRRVLAEAPPEARHEIRREEYALEDVQVFVRDRLRREKRVSFVALVKTRPRAFVITAFLAVLELARTGEVVLVVPADPADFFVEPNPAAAPPDEAGGDGAPAGGLPPLG